MSNEEQHSFGIVMPAYEINRTVDMKKIVLRYQLINRPPLRGISFPQRSLLWLGRHYLN